MLNLYYNDLLGNIEEYEGEKKYLMGDDYTLGKVLDKIKRIGIEKLDWFWLIKMINWQMILL